LILIPEQMCPCGDARRRIWFLSIPWRRKDTFDLGLQSMVWLREAV
jgi:hypothetical protein